MSFKEFMNTTRKEAREKEFEINVSDAFPSFKVRLIGYKEFSKIQEQNTTKDIEESDKVVRGRKKRRREIITNTNEPKLNFDLCVTAITYPDLKDAELQNFYGVYNPEDLLDAMLSIEEIADLGNKIIELSDLDENINDKIDEAKN